MITLQPVETHMNTLQEEEIDQILSRWNDTEIPKPETIEDARSLMEYYYALNMTGGEFETENLVLERLRDSLEPLLENPATLAAATDLFAEWGLLVISRIPEMKDSFASLPMYEELIEKLSNGPLDLKYKLSLMRIQLLHHFKYWERLSGSRPEVLPDEEREFLAQNIKGFPKETEDLIEAYKAENNVSGWTSAKHALFRFYTMLAMTDKALKLGEELKKDWELRPDYNAGDVAEIEMDLGRLLFATENYAEALKHFEEARKIYESLGEDWELFTYKAEGQIELCQFRLG